ncbi:MAG: M48 family metalloprotease [Burkholderiaceae bacterium]|nr:M48 family metalloprotease [Burkholderiaceae bacterium]
MRFRRDQEAAQASRHDPLERRFANRRGTPTGSSRPTPRSCCCTCSAAARSNRCACARAARTSLGSRAGARRAGTTRSNGASRTAAGWRADDAVVAVTRGALERRDRAELQGVVAHELSHLVHGDTTLNMRLIGMVCGLRLLFDLGRGLTAPDGRGRRHVGVLFGVALMAVGALGWLAGRLLQAAVSRQREFLADASAVKYTRQVAGLGSALRKIAEQQRRHADELAARTGALAHLFLVSSSFGGWWATHPPLAERIRRLYGRAMPSLPADVLPPPMDDAPELPVVALAPTTARRANAAAPEAAHHDALQRPGLAPPEVQRRARESEALQRIALWHGAGELRAALLALLRPPGADDAAAWQTLPPARAAAMRADLDALAPTTRLVTFDALARRAASWAAAPRRALLADAKTFATTPSVALRWLLLRQRLRGAALGFAAPGPRNALAARGDDLTLATPVLADALGADSGTASRWARRARHALGILDRPTPPLRPPRAWRALVRLQRVAGLQRPLPVREWVAAWAADPALASSDTAAATLLTAARLLEAPLPPALGARVPDVESQWRSL